MAKRKRAPIEYAWCWKSKGKLARFRGGRKRGALIGWSVRKPPDDDDTRYAAEQCPGEWVKVRIEEVDDGK